MPAVFNVAPRTVFADLPKNKNVTAYFLSLTDQRNFTVSTLHEETE